MSIGSLSKRGQSRGGDAGGATNNLLVQAVNYKLDGNGSEPSRNDVMVVALLHDAPALGLKAEFDEAGNPTTMVDLVLNYFEKNERMAKKVNVAKRTQVREFLIGKDGKDKVKRDEGYVMEVEAAYYDERAKRLVARYLKRASNKFLSEDRAVLANQLICVRPEGSSKRDDGSVRQYQYRILPYVGPNQTFALSGTDAFAADPAGTLKAAVARVFAGLASEEASIGRPMAMLRVVGYDNGVLDGREYPIYQGFKRAADPTQSRPFTPEETADAFLASETIAGEVLGAMEETKTDDQVFWEVIPAQQIPTGLRSLPSQIVADRVANGRVVSDQAKAGFDESTPFLAQVPGEDRPVPCYAMANLVVRRNYDDIESRYKPWFATLTTPIETFCPTLYQSWEIPTAQMPEKMLADVHAAARNRAEEARKSRRDAASQRGSSVEEETATSKPEADANTGAPDEEPGVSSYSNI